ncbi:pyridoxine/pyridoxamine 5'-phosphate oxidase-like [Hetaerina americana]|uniref:pyridoxine/pyridoxamine 5'-phosphate oxidase-like n=1 Tax=Hetaerina americana TaxID=62018 RepID=UPI003A7F18A9
MAPFPTSSSGFSETSYLFKITPPSSDPMDLFKGWLEAAKEADVPFANRISVSSSSSTGHVTSRSLLLRQLDDDGFIIMTDRRSLKCKQWEDNPVVAFTFFWGYKLGERTIARQVRAEGRIEELSSSEYAHIYNGEPLYCKIRSHICHQGQRIEWDELKSSHDELLQEVKAGFKTLSQPNHVATYKLHPTMLEFYEADDVSIGDRIVFLRDNGINEWKGSWKHHHIAA